MHDLALAPLRCNQPTNGGGRSILAGPPPLQPPNQTGGRKTRPDPKRHNTQVVLERFSVFVILERHQHRWSRKTTSHCMCLCLGGLTPRHKYKSVGVDDCPSTPVCVPILVLQRNSFVCLIKFLTCHDHLCLLLFVVLTFHT